MRYRIRKSGNFFYIEENQGRPFSRWKLFNYRLLGRQKVQYPSADEALHGLLTNVKYTCIWETKHDNQEIIFEKG